MERSWQSRLADSRKSCQTCLDTGGELRLFDVTTGQQILSRQDNKRVNCVAFSPDSQLLAVGGGLGATGKVQVLNIKNLLPPDK